jgi:Holliday junction resolvase RusA-like endonuclease
MPKTPRTISCVLPRYDTDRKKWRRAILECARKQADRCTGGWERDGPFEVVVLLYAKKGKQHDRYDVDNRLKDVLDALQGAYSAKVKGKYRVKTRVIRNDSSVCRVVVEKHVLPKTFKNRRIVPGGRLLIRPYTKHAWPLQATKAAKGIRAHH